MLDCIARTMFHLRTTGTVRGVQLPLIRGICGREIAYRRYASTSTDVDDDNCAGVDAGGVGGGRGGASRCGDGEGGGGKGQEGDSAQLSRPVKRKRMLSEKQLAHRFVDFKQIGVTGGSGGDGCMSFLSLLRNEWAGPDGADGGNGGHVTFFADERYKSLSHLESLYRGEDGARGRNKHCTGANASHLRVPVPLGTFFRNSSNSVVADLKSCGESFVAARGGYGGHGNHFYLSNEQRAPTAYETGGKGDELTVFAEMRVIADVGLIGFPNAGKSTLLRAISKARPKVASYPFTTLNPHVGIVDFYGNATGDNQLSVADIPGIIEGASKDRGLGLSFLRHIERCRLLAFVVDLSATSPSSPSSSASSSTTTIHLDAADQVEALMRELNAYCPSLLKRTPHVLLGNKADADPTPLVLQRYRELRIRYPESPAFAISAKQRENLSAVLRYLKLRVHGDRGRPE